MNFNVFSFWEKHYKRIMRIIVILITFGSIFLYFYFNKDADIAFIISIVYALILFDIGIYSNYMDNIINNRYFIRKKTYLNLKKLKSVLKSINLSSQDDNKLLLLVISFKTFTSRGKGMSNAPPYIKEDGFKFNFKKLVIEDKFITQRNNLTTKLNKELSTYIEEMSIEQKYPYINIISVFFDQTEWYKKYDYLSETDLINIQNFISNLYIKYKNEINELKKTMNRVVHLYSKCYKKANDNIKRIEDTYGNKLHNELSKEDDYNYDINHITTLIDNLSKTVYTYEDAQEHIDDINNSFISIAQKLNDIEANLTDEINSINDSYL